jgi:hypothetical protein
VVENRTTYHSCPVCKKIYSVMVVADWWPYFSLLVVVSTDSLYFNKNYERKFNLFLSCFHNYSNTSWLICSSYGGLLTHSCPDSPD